MKTIITAAILAAISTNAMAETTVIVCPEAIVNTYVSAYIDNRSVYYEGSGVERSGATFTVISEDGIPTSMIVKGPETLKQPENTSIDLTRFTSPDWWVSSIDGIDYTASIRISNEQILGSIVRERTEQGTITLDHNPLTHSDDEEVMLPMRHITYVDYRNCYIPGNSNGGTITDVAHPGSKYK